MKLKYRFAIQKLGSGYAAVAIGADAGRFNGMLRINESGKVMLETLQADCTAEDILAALKGHFTGDEGRMREQIDKFCASLRKEGLLEE